MKEYQIYDRLNNMALNQQFVTLYLQINFKNYDKKYSSLTVKVVKDDNKEYCIYKHDEIIANEIEKELHIGVQTSKDLYHIINSFISDKPERCISIILSFDDTHNICNIVHCY